MKSFGPAGRSNTKPVAREPFEFTFMRDDEPETYTFNARAVTDTAGIASTLGVAEKHPERALPGMLRMISKMLDNKDGTPRGWEPKVLPPPQAPADQPTLSGEFDVIDDEPDDEPEPKFRGPDGELHPMSAAEKFQAFEAGSSRRRWHQLMDDDEEITADGKALIKLFEWLVGLAAGRPTRP